MSLFPNIIQRCVGGEWGRSGDNYTPFSHFCGFRYPNWVSWVTQPTPSEKVPFHSDFWTHMLTYSSTKWAPSPQNIIYPPNSQGPCLTEYWAQVIMCLILRFWPGEWIVNWTTRDCTDISWILASFFLSASLHDNTPPKSITELWHDKTNKMSVRPSKTQISLGIHPVWSESSLSA